MSTQLSKLQLSAVKKMAKSLTPLENNIMRVAEKMKAYAKTKKAEFEAKMAEYETIIAQNEEEIANINQAIATYTGGVTLQEILNPEANMGEVVVSAEDIDADAIAEMEQILPYPSVEEIEEEEDVDEENQPEA